MASHGFAQDAAAANAFMKQGQALEKAGRFEQAAAAFDKAAAAYETAGDATQHTAALEQSALMYEKFADELVKRAGAVPPAARPPVAVPAQPTPAPPQPALRPDVAPPANVTPPANVAPPANIAPVAPVGAAPIPLDQSAIVNAGAKGLAVAEKTGKPIDGIKLSRHDSDIHSPSIAVAPDGTIHVAFVEQRAESPYTVSVYHRSSRDGGATWSDAKNLSEVLPEYVVGNCQVAVDGANRAYVIWHTGVTGGYPTDMDPHSMANNNLVYRVLSDGAWSGKAVFIPPVHEKKDEGNAKASWFVTTDPRGQVHVIWNMLPYSRHPEALTRYGPSPAIGASMVMESDLNGSQASDAREIYCANIANDPSYNSPGCDQFDLLDGYVDAAGKAHFIAQVYYAGVGASTTADKFCLVEDGKQSPAVSLPGSAGEYWSNPPRLLVDAAGHQHIIARYMAGEQPNVRDYLVGSDAEPVVIRTTTEVKGALRGMQAFQGAGGHMIALMQMNDTGAQTDDELYVSTSDGGAWTKPVNVTNNTGRTEFFSRNVNASGTSNVAQSAYWFPSQAAAAYDPQGHLSIIYISNKMAMTQSTAGAWVVGFSSRVPNLLFLRF